MLAAAPMKRLPLYLPALRRQRLNTSARQSRCERSMTKTAPVMKSAINSVASCDRGDPRRLTTSQHFPLPTDDVQLGKLVRI